MHQEILTVHQVMERAADGLTLCASGGIRAPHAERRVSASVEAQASCASSRPLPTLYPPAPNIDTAYGCMLAGRTSSASRVLHFQCLCARCYLLVGFTGPCTYNAVGLLSPRRGVARVAPPLPHHLIPSAAGSWGVPPGAAAHLDACVCDLCRENHFARNQQPTAAKRQAS